MSKGCRKCGGHHNTLLHEYAIEQNVETAPVWILQGRKNQG